MLQQLRFITLALGLLLSSTAFAMSLQEAMAALTLAKEQGLVGELPNGYLGLIKPTGQAPEIVKLINDARAAEYQRLAKDNGIKQSDVETMAGKKAVERTAPGLYIQVGGEWVKK